MAAYFVIRVGGNHCEATIGKPTNNAFLTGFCGGANDLIIAHVSI